MDEVWLSHRSLAFNQSNDKRMHDCADSHGACAGISAGFGVVSHEGEDTTLENNLNYNEEGVL